MENNCVYRGELAGPAIHTCLLRQQQCTTESGKGECALRLQMDDPAFAQKWTDPLTIIDRRRQRTEALRGLLAGGAAFLIGGGPSANDLPLELLSKRGIWSLAVNNSAGHPRIRPQAFVCSDPPSKFSHSIWLDPGIMKFVPSPKMSGRRAQLRRRTRRGFRKLRRTVTQCPNVWGFQRNSWLWPDERFFLSDGACWGNHQSGVEKTKQPKTVNTMFLAIRLLVYLGARRIYLVGVDFRMTPEAGYSFEQGRTPEACSSNNAQFQVANNWLVEMERKGVFKRFGIEIYNTNLNSGLRAFSYFPFVDAIKSAKGLVEDTPVLSGWYEK